MKNKYDLADDIFDLLTSDTNLLGLLGQFKNEETGEEEAAIAYDGVPEYLSIPDSFLVYNFETSTGLPSESRTVLERVVVKFFVRSDKRHRIVECLSQLLDGKIIGKYKATYQGQTSNPQEKVLNIRFLFI